MSFHFKYRGRKLTSKSVFAIRRLHHNRAFKLVSVLRSRYGIGIFEDIVGNYRTTHNVLGRFV